MTETRTEADRHFLRTLDQICVRVESFAIQILIVQDFRGHAMHVLPSSRCASEPLRHAAPGTVEEMPAGSIRL